MRDSGRHGFRQSGLRGHCGYALDEARLSDTANLGRERANAWRWKSLSRSAGCREFENETLVLLPARGLRAQLDDQPRSGPAGVP